ncbi:MAG: sigma-54 dependent transcriptional regulator [Isosphaeraceae bacterium]|nr:sigma-54 dependent transcriptional regulator [Isosphaeraceae bacterium]
MSRILVVDDNEAVCFALGGFLEDSGHSVSVAGSSEDGLRIAAQKRFDALILDIRLPGVDGLAAIPRFREVIGEAPIIIITAFGNLDTAVRAMKAGAFDYLVKPFDLEQAARVIDRAVRGEVARDGGVHEPVCVDEDGLIGSSPAMQSLFKRIALVAPTDVPVLLTGESGTGKEVVARAIHRHGARRAGPFLPICLAALSPTLIERELFGHRKGSFTGADQDRKGLLELAGGGTVLLDEIGDVPLDLQVKILRMLEHREFTPVGDARPRATDVRFIAATNRSLPELIKEGRFREDLYFRLNVFPIHLPPLSDRKEDIPLLAEYFLGSARSPGEPEATLTPEAMEELSRRRWAGNVRELRNAVEYAAILARGRSIRPEHLPSRTSQAADGSVSIAHQLEDLVKRWVGEQVETVDELEDLHERFLGLGESTLLRATLESCGWNRARAARMLGIHRSTLRQKLERLGISDHDPEGT